MTFDQPRPVDHSSPSRPGTRDAQDVLITLVTPAETEPTRDAVTYWDVAETPPTGDDPLDALLVRLAAAYEEPSLLTFHLDDVGSAAGRPAELADPEGRRAPTGTEKAELGELAAKLPLVLG
ncbi:hypothetical protein [Streptomyces celluloflavus]|uniref:hypothetical protein n=1 Tax=Streptomyces celluloflavus TaxID=58344 RepID=UPI00367914CB